MFLAVTPSLISIKSGNTSRKTASMPLTAGLRGSSKLSKLLDEIALFLLLEQLPLARDVAAVALRQGVLPHRAMFSCTMICSTRC
jgi:hypothetical protein